MWRRWRTPQNLLLAFTDELWKTWKIKILKKWKKKKTCWRYHHFTRVPKTTIKWGTFPGIQSETEFFVIFDHFLPFYPPKNSENQNFEKMKKTSGAPKNMIWCMLTQIWSVTDIILCHFRPFFALLPNY